MDHAVADGRIEPLIIVCPTYNNTSDKDSANYSLALQLTDQYHQELTGDLIPAVEGKYSTYAEDTTGEGLKKSRDHRGFGGFSMGSVATWHTFQYCLDYFRYFMPMSGSLSSDGGYMADNEQDGNLAFREQEGGVHDGNYASQYTYNGLMWFWKKIAVRQWDRHRRRLPRDKSIMGWLFGK